MATYTLTQLQDRVSDLTGYESPFVTATEKTMLINSAIERYRLRASRINPALFLDTDTIAVVSGTPSYSLPTGCMKVVAVYVKNGTTDVLLDAVNWQDRYRIDTTASSSSKTDAMYAIRGAKMWIWPSPTWAGTVYVDFIPSHTALSGSSDSFDGGGVDGWDQWVLGDVCETLAIKAEDSEKGWRLLKVQAEEIMRYAAKIDNARPRTVTDTYSGSTWRSSWRI